MSLMSIESPKLDTVTIEVAPPDTVKLKGTLTQKEPALLMAEYFKAIHRDAIQGKVDHVKVDVSELTFVNSSTIRLFIDWATWVKNESTHPYILRFLTSRHVTWQKTSFMALSTLMRTALTVEKVD